MRDLTARGVARRPLLNDVGRLRAFLLRGASRSHGSFGGALVGAPAVARGLKLTTAFLASLRTSKRHGRIDGYNDLHNKDEADDRNDQYADLVDSYLSLIHI